MHEEMWKRHVCPPVPWLAQSFLIAMQYHTSNFVWVSVCVCVCVCLNDLIVIERRVVAHCAHCSQLQQPIIVPTLHWFVSLQSGRNTNTKNTIWSIVDCRTCVSVFFPNQWYRMHDNDGSLPNEGLQPLLTAPTQLHLAQTYSCRASVYSCRAHQQTAETTFEHCCCWCCYAFHANVLCFLTFRVTFCLFCVMWGVL